MRAGRSTPEEIAYCEKLIEYFSNGSLPTPQKLKLTVNDFLANMLKSKQSRLTKKMKNARFSARRYVRKDGITLTLEEANSITNGLFPVDAWHDDAQGIILVCTSPMCMETAGKPRWIVYQGGAVTIKTATVMDCETKDMSQVWTTSIACIADSVSYQQAFDLQTGGMSSVIDRMSPKLNHNIRFTFIDIFRHLPPALKIPQLAFG